MIDAECVKMPGDDSSKSITLIEKLEKNENYIYAKDYDLRSGNVNHTEKNRNFTKLINAIEDAVS